MAVKKSILILAVVLLSFTSLVSASESTKSPATADGAFITSPFDGAGSGAWTNATSIFSANDNRAVASLVFPVLSRSQGLRASNFGFAIPTGATIDGIVVKIERLKSGAGGSVTD